MCTKLTDRIDPIPGFGKMFYDPEASLCFPHFLLDVVTADSLGTPDPVSKRVGIRELDIRVADINVSGLLDLLASAGHCCGNEALCSDSMRVWGHHTPHRTWSNTYSPIRHTHGTATVV